MADVSRLPATGSVQNWDAMNALQRFYEQRMHNFYVNMHNEAEQMGIRKEAVEPYNTDIEDATRRIKLEEAMRFLESRGGLTKLPIGGGRFDYLDELPPSNRDIKFYPYNRQNDPFSPYYPYPEEGMDLPVSNLDTYLGGSRE